MEVQIPKKLALSMLLEDKTVKESIPETVVLLNKVVKILYGVNPESLATELFTATIEAICERFVNPTVQDIKNAFNYAEIEKKPYQTLTRDELLQPINEYFKKKQIIQAELLKIEKKKEADLKGEQNKTEFMQGIKKKYLECLEKGLPWSGDECESHAISMRYAQTIGQETKNDLWRMAVTEFKTRTHEAKNEITNNSIAKIVPPAEKIYSRLLIEFSLAIKWKWIEE